MASATTHTSPMSATRKAALVAGLFYIATFVFSIPALGFYDSAINDENWVRGAGSHSGVAWGGFFEIITALTGIGTAVAVYPVIKRYAPARALGFVASRTLEAAAIFVGVMALVAMYSMRQDLDSIDATGVDAVMKGLVGVHDGSFLLGPGYMPAINALCFATVLYQTRLVPRIIPVIGFVGGPLLFISSTVTLFGGWEQVTGVSMAFAIPIAAWELSVGCYMLVKGFRTPSGDTVEPDFGTAEPAAVLAGV
jgi:hypothetical protein